MPRNGAVSALVLSLAVSMCLASCHHAAKTESTPPDTAERPLAVYAVQRIVVAPTAHVRPADSLGWVQQMSGVRAAGRLLDSVIVAVLDARGLAKRWVLPAELVHSYERNRSYATDPYQLAVEEVRAGNFAAAKKYGEPLSSQLRTMIALHEDARFVLLPIDLRFERAGAGGRAVLRVALLDPRFAESKFVADIPSDAARTPADALASLATRLADLFAAP